MSLTDLMLWNQNAAGRVWPIGQCTARVEQSMDDDARVHTSSSSYGRLWKLVEGREGELCSKNSGRSWEA